MSVSVMPWIGEKNMPMWPSGDDAIIFRYLGPRSSSSWHDPNTNVIGLAHGAQVDTVVHELLHMYELEYIKQFKKSPHIDFLLKRSKGRKATDRDGDRYAEGDFEEELFWEGVYWRVFETCFARLL